MRAHHVTPRPHARIHHPPPCTWPPAQPASAPRPQPCAHGVGRVTWSGAGMREPHHSHPSRDGSQKGGPVLSLFLTLTPPSAGLDDFEAKSAEGRARVGHRFFDGVFFLELVEYSNFAVSRSGASLPRTPPRTLSSLPPSACAAHPALSPRAGCESHDSCPPVCAGSKLIIHPVHPERAAASRAAAGVPHAPMRLVGPSPSHAAHDCLRAAGPRATP